MKILLTGANGFLGSHLLRRLVLDEETQVIILKRSFSNVELISDLLTSPRIQNYDIDITPLEDIFSTNSIDVIIHTATEYGRDGDAELKTLQTNYHFPLKLLELALEQNVKFFINTDSYFNKIEGTYSFLKDYVTTKKAFADVLRNKSKNIRVAHMVLEHLYGKNDKTNKFIPNIIDQIAVQQKSEIPMTPAQQLRDFIYVEDVVEAYLTVLTSFKHLESPGFETFEVGTGTSVRIEDLVTTIKTLSKSKSHFLFGALPYRENEIMISEANTKNLKTLGWSPQHSLTLGLKKTMGLL